MNEEGRAHVEKRDPRIYISKDIETAYTNRDVLKLARSSRIIHAGLDRGHAFAFFVFAIKADISIDRALSGLARNIDKYDGTFNGHGKRIVASLRHCILTSSIQPVLIDNKPYFVLSSYSYYQ